MIWELLVLQVKITRNFCMLKNTKIIQFFTGLNPGSQSLRYSKSESSDVRKLQSSKWGSVNTDSGISLFSADTLKHKECMSSCTSTSNFKPPSRSMPPMDLTHIKQLEDLRRKQEEETRRYALSYISSFTIYIY